MHIALQGCLRAGAIEYGITADTGGHIQYLLALVAASAADPDIERIDIVTRAFDCDFSAHDYRCPVERIDDKITLYRLPTDTPGYLDKQALAGELDSFTRALGERIGRVMPRPDVIHAHYADAAEVAAGIEARHGIPFVFTAHSLGRVKQACTDAPADAALERRIAFEENALARARLVLASSRDEAEVQYAGYREYDPGRIRVLQPGIDAPRFAAGASGERVAAMLARFLAAPDKPAILAIARPVSRKNLAGLVRAFGQSEHLRAKANLVIVAGTRTRLAALEPEAEANMRELLALIDDYDLHGRIAYPKRHETADVPGFYAWARERGGVFVNPAFNEPFGLTLLEAAAAGLPVVATDSGGPNDIVAHCRNGMLVSPRDPHALAGAIDTLLSDRLRWQRCARAGARASTDYDWHQHAARYHALLRDLVSVPRPAPVAASAHLLV
ncbi:glycosyltransferase [Salinisphaera sp.]|uniref:glycosyltransferase n=1 Tax=Salinisphaera sp. TaxID=1914330 RepID=UPI002D76E2F8|nr:glycosyltransferase [Salinisphaera sp.]HET7313991.1 glycosyltransferase [Salinisphaera sp.]